LDTYFNEDFLHFLWKYQYLNTSNLIGSKGETIAIIVTGLHNDNSGPDFFNAKIKIDGQLWAGNIEIHLKSSDWFVHHHEVDKAYDSVILHVVWEDDVPIFNSVNSPLTTLVIKDYIDEKVLKNYHSLFLQPKKWINCEKDIAQTNEFLWNQFKEKLYFDRIEKKVLFIEKLLIESNNDWEAVLFKLLAKNFGLKVNGEVFLQMANAVPFQVVRKCSNSVLQLEALFFGITNLLESTNHTDYLKTLQKEYAFLKNKFRLQKEPFNVYPNFFRLRPNNFPTIRLSQLANLFYVNANLFSTLMQTNTLKDFYSILSVGVSPFWETHYTFDSQSKKSSKKLTKSFMDLLLINTIIPLQVAYQKHIGNFNPEKTITLIQSIKSEKNAILDKYKSLQVVSKNAMDSQALLHLYTNYCTKNKCLNCVVGNRLLKIKS